MRGGKGKGLCACVACTHPCWCWCWLGWLGRGWVSCLTRYRSSYCISVGTGKEKDNERKDPDCGVCTVGGTYIHSAQVGREETAVRWMMSCIDFFWNDKTASIAPTPPWACTGKPYQSHQSLPHPLSSPPSLSACLSVCLSAYLPACLPRATYYCLCVSSSAWLLSNILWLVQHSG